MDSPDPYAHSQGFLNLLTSQEENSFSFPPSSEPASSQLPRYSTQYSNDPNVTAETKTTKRKWHPTEDIVLISAWLNTSKDPIVGNDQKAGAFWSRITDWFNNSRQLAAFPDRTVSHCKQRWGRINDQTCKFVGCYEAALKEQSSGMNDNDLMKTAHEIFLNDHGFKFGLEHAWRELRHDQKWSSLSAVKESEGKKRKKGDDCSQASATSQHQSYEEDSSVVRPPGVKAAKNARSKRSAPDKDDGKEVSDVVTMWEIKQHDLAMKDKLSKQKLLDSLVLRTDSLTEKEMVVKEKLLNELFF
ncbi:glutathione S-transferase T3-like [Eutrema salsugineum]|uniref:glutathione S-transferase T3-like n=1 Tax=Eutrema salsugineum TaxID=72664 RepID=UPI000CED5A1F|nr:glutathione S-transferase T3-like [Eutrema salsugineum]